MVKPAEHRDSMDPALVGAPTSNRLLLAESLVWTRFVVEADVLGDNSSWVFLVQDEDVVENLSSERSGEAFSEGVHVWDA